MKPTESWKPSAVYTLSEFWNFVLALLAGIATVDGILLAVWLGRHL